MVLIKDMEIPKCCFECPLWNAMCSYKEWQEAAKGRPDYCPLTEVDQYGPEGTLHEEI